MNNYSWKPLKFTLSLASKYYGDSEIHGIEHVICVCTMSRKRGWNLHWYILYTWYKRIDHDTRLLLRTKLNLQLWWSSVKSSSVVSLACAPVPCTSGNLLVMIRLTSTLNHSITKTIYVGGHWFRNGEYLYNNCSVPIECPLLAWVLNCPSASFGYMHEWRVLIGLECLLKQQMNPSILYIRTYTPLARKLYTHNTYTLR